MYWEESGKISKLKNNFLQKSLLLQPVTILIIIFCNLKIFIQLTMLILLLKHFQ